MILRLGLLFTVVTSVELITLLYLGSWLGVLETALLILTTGFVGAWLAQREGRSVLLQLRNDLAQGIPPASRLVEGLLVFAGGLLLLTPGVFTDLTGFAFLVPFTRRALAPIVVDQLTRWMERSGGSFSFEVGAPRPHDPSPPSNEDTPFDHPVS